MRFFWPIRERSPSTDSECSTASQSSLASDASFFSAAADEADLAVADWSDFQPISDDGGVGLHTFAPVSASTSAEMETEVAPRAVPLLGTGAALRAATSGTGRGPAAPIAPPTAAALEACSDQETARPSAALPRRFGGQAAGPAHTDPSRAYREQARGADRLRHPRFV
ncbi:hypothetical protein DVH05_028332 [Phytophthora capsici]|nr:hypothetical protein DVH05_028332 [Phytophthora capsici]